MYYQTTKAVRELGLPQSPITDALETAVNWFVNRGYVDNYDFSDRSGAGNR